ncbi:MAG: iron-containing redox enzyme family protein [Xanthomonadaceae bacterium]|nr:iron-containing redox enzyme family protein [Xanthomonadaceae bacterium]MDE1964495.1 iron-containing redox enzyme family protein [Xanthomonadaceae bacterium]
MQAKSDLKVHDRLVLDTEASRQSFLAIPIIRRALAGQVSRDEYLRFLQQAYHHVHHTVRLMMGMGYFLPERLHWMQPAIAEYIAEEIGHDQWILDDIDAIGGDGEAVRGSRPGEAVELMVAYAHDTLRRGNPVGFLGMVFVLEGISAALASRAATAIQQALTLPGQGLRYLTSHGALDQEHVGFFEQLVNRLDDPADQDALIHAANRFYGLYGAMFQAIDHPAGS